MNLLFLLKQIMKRGCKTNFQLEANAISDIIYEDKNSGFGHIKDLKVIIGKYMKRI